MISQKSKYALKALIVLAEEYGKGPVLIADIAAREHIPRSFLELILLELKNHRFLDSRKGRGGGYLLAQTAPRKFPRDRCCARLRDRWRRCHARARRPTADARSAKTNATCAVRLLMCDVREATAHILDTTMLADLLGSARK